MPRRPWSDRWPSLLRGLVALAAVLLLFSGTLTGMSLAFALAALVFLMGRIEELQRQLQATHRMVLQLAAALAAPATASKGGATAHDAQDPVGAGSHTPMAALGERGTGSTSSAPPGVEPVPVDLSR